MRGCCSASRACRTSTRQNVHEWIRYEGLDNFLRARDRGKGVLVATAHLGNWELSAFAHALMTAPMNVVVRPLDNTFVDCAGGEAADAVG